MSLSSSERFRSWRRRERKREKVGREKGDDNIKESEVDDDDDEVVVKESSRGGGVAVVGGVGFS